MANFQPIVRVLTLASCAALAHAQTPTEPARLVRLNVVAFESNGQPASGLTAADFQIADQNKTERITIFSPAAAQSPAGPHEFSNRPAAGTHATVILFDFLNDVNAAERLDSARKLGPALKQLPSGESLFLYLLGPDGTLVPLHEFPKSGAAAQDKAWTQNAESMIMAAAKKYNKPKPGGMSDEDGVKKTYVALETIGNQLSMFPGRKDILWITSAVPYVMNPQITCKADWWDCALYVPHLTVTLDRAGVAVNPFSYISLSVDYSRTMEELAGLTGGHAYLNQELADVLKEFGQTAGAYTIGYAPSADNWDSKYHRLKITCERKGVKIQAKQHYYALPDQRPIATRQQSMMVAAYQSGSLVSEIGLKASVSQIAPNKLKIDVKVDPSDLELHEAGGQYTGAITLLLSARAGMPEGEPTLGDIELHMTKDQHDAALKDGIPISKEYPIDANTKSVRLIVLDKSTDSVGSLDVPVTR